MTVEWRPIAGFPGYQVSNDGQIAGPRSITRGSVNRGGYLVVQLRGTSRYVHGLVAEAFIGPRPIGHEVRHLDGDSNNNAAANLRYGTHAENMQDRVKHGRDPQAARTHCPRHHEYTPENTYRQRATGARVCRICARQRSRDYEIRKQLRTAALSS